MRYLGKQAATQTGLSIFQIKIIAAACMTLSSIGYNLYFFFPPYFRCLFLAFQNISVALFSFCLLEGLYNTKSKLKYACRLLISCILVFTANACVPLSEPVHIEGFFLPPDILFVYFSATLSVFILEIFYRKITLNEPLDVRSLLFCAVVILTFAIICLCWPDLYMPLREIDYIFVVPLIALLYFVRKRKWQLIIFLMVCVFLLVQGIVSYQTAKPLCSITTYLFAEKTAWMMALAVPVMLFYRGSRGPCVKWPFYIYFPAHIYVLYFLGIYLVGK